MSKSYPHPVLGIGNDVDSICRILPSPISKDSSSYHFHFDLLMDNEDIINLINQGKAVFSCEISCSPTYYRRIITSTDPSIDVEIARKEVAKRIEFETYIVATQPITDYVNSCSHPDFEGFSFQIEPGDILAVFKSGHYDVDIKYDKLRSAGSFIKIIPGDDETNTIYNLDAEKIEIKLPKTLYDDYKLSFNGPGKHANIFHSSLAFNALVYALMNYSDQEYGDRLWARTLKVRMEIEDNLKRYKDILGNKEVPNENLKLAQALLSNPYKRMFKTMHELIAVHDNQEED